jgi:hypothetical protein
MNADKESQFFSYNITANSFNAFVDSRILIDKLRISMSINNMTNTVRDDPGVLVWCSLVSDYIGCIGNTVVSDAGGNVTVHDVHKVSDGYEVAFETKKKLLSNYIFKLYNMDGTEFVPADVNNDSVFNVMFEYYSF